MLLWISYSPNFSVSHWRWNSVFRNSSGTKTAFPLGIAFEWTNLLTQIGLCLCLCVCTCVLSHRGSRRDTGQTEQTTSSSKASYLHCPAGVRGHKPSVSQRFRFDKEQRTLFHTSFFLSCLSNLPLWCSWWTLFSWLFFQTLRCYNDCSAKQFIWGVGLHSLQFCI